MMMNLINISINGGIIMDRLKNISNVIYDSNIIIYYCFSYKNHRIVEKTSKSRKLTQFLVNQNSNIVVPDFIILEIKRKGFRKIIEEYMCAGQNNIVDLPKVHTNAFKFKLRNKIYENFINLQKKDYFIVENYIPDDDLLDNIKSFFKNYNDIEKMNIFLGLKNRDSPLPSEVDLKLILFSKYMEAPLISNDYDITFFAEELFSNNLSYRIYDFKSIGYCN